jgi:hypothetical protein
MANSDVDEGAPSDLSAGRRRYPSDLKKFQGAEFVAIEQNCVQRDFDADPWRKLTAGEHERELARLAKERRKTMAQHERKMRQVEGAGLLPRIV